MGYSTENSLRKKSKTKKQEERERKMKNKTPAAKNKLGKLDHLNRMN